MPIFYAAVEDDPLSSGRGSQLLPGASTDTIKGEDGRYRRLAYVGDKAWCVACRSVGVIVAVARLDDSMRMIDFTLSGRRQAVGGDKVACKCERMPEIIAVHGCSWMITDNSDANQQANTSRPTTGTAAHAIRAALHDEQFTLIDANGKPLADMYYTVRLPSGELKHGTADSHGRTARYQTNGTQNISIHLGHKQES